VLSSVLQLDSKFGQCIARSARVIHVQSINAHHNASTHLPLLDKPLSLLNAIRESSSSNPPFLVHDKHHQQQESSSNKQQQSGVNDHPNAKHCQVAHLEFYISKWLGC
jgi:hypothetical protein